jgi:hypothetical protein
VHHQLAQLRVMDAGEERLGAIDLDRVEDEPAEGQVDRQGQQAGQGAGGAERRPDHTPRGEGAVLLHGLIRGAVRSSLQAPPDAPGRGQQRQATGRHQAGRPQVGVDRPDGVQEKGLGQRGQACPRELPGHHHAGGGRYGSQRGAQREAHGSEAQEGQQAIRQRQVERGGAGDEGDRGHGEPGGHQGHHGGDHPPPRRQPAQAVGQQGPGRGAAGRAPHEEEDVLRHVEDGEDPCQADVQQQRPRGHQGRAAGDE